MAKVGNWIAELTTTIGQGNITLSGTVPGFARFRDAVGQGPVWYSITDSANREAGIGTFNGSNQLVRSTIHSTLVNGVYDGVSPTPISLTGAGAEVACTFNTAAFNTLMDHLAATDNPHNVVSSQLTYDPTNDPVTDLTQLQDAMVDHGNSIEERVPSMSGVVSGGLITGGVTEFSIAAGEGVVYDNHTNPNNTSITRVNWLDTLNIPIQTGTLSVGTIRVFITAAGDVLQVAGTPSLSLWRNNIFLGAVFFINGEVTEVTNAPAIIKQTATDSYDLMTRNITIDGSDIEPVTDELQIYTTAGSMFYPGISWYEDDTNPNTALIPQIGGMTTPAAFYTMTQTGLIGPEITTIPTDYNGSGDALSGLPGNDATIHRLYSVGAGDDRKLVLLYGQNQYPTSQNAKDNLQVDESNTTFPEEADAVYLLGYICVEGNAPDFNDIDDAWIVSVQGGEGAGSSSVTTDHTVLVNRGATDQHPIEAIGAPGGEQLRDTLDNKMVWAGLWTEGDYLAQNVVFDPPWTMIANKDTSERAAPQLYGTPRYVFTGALTPESQVLNQLVFGTRYTVIEPVEIDTIRVDMVNTFTYDIYYIRNPLSAPIYQLLTTITADSDGWKTINVHSGLIPAGQTFDIVAVIAEAEPSPVTWSDDWTYTTPNNENEPGLGEAVQANKALTLLKFNTTSLTGPTGTQLEDMNVGDTIEGDTLSWSIQGITTAGNVVTYSVAPASQEPWGTKTFTFNTVAPTALPYSVDIGYYSTVPNVQGILGNGYINAVIGDDAYGVDVAFQNYTVSEDWDVVARSS